MAKKRLTIVLMLMGTIGCVTGSGLLTAAEPDPVAMAMSTLFSPDRAPPNRTMGLVQRNFLDLVEQSKSKLQVALVIDGTASMASSLSGIKDTIGQMFDDISLYKEADVSYQVVVYRDSGSPTGEIVFPLGSKQFESNQARLHEAVASVDPENGAPFFHELIDVGVQTAITELAWADDDETTKWLIVVGDAPPYDAGFEDSETGARRRFETTYLTGLATERGIKINCLLCSSRDAEAEAYHAVLEKTQAFMSTLATETGGLMLDLSYPAIRETLLAASAKRKTKYLKIGEITQSEVDVLRRQAEKTGSSLAHTQRVSIAVLPHVELTAMSFDPDRPEVRMAADLRQRMRNLPGVDVVSSRNVMKRFQRLNLKGVKEEAVLQMLANSLSVDYVVWGTVSDGAKIVKVSSSVYRRLDGKQVAASGLIEQSKLNNEQSALASATTTVLRKVMSDISGGPSTPMRAVFARAQRKIGPEEQVRLTPVSNNGMAQDALMIGYEALEQAAAFEVGVEEANPLLAKAEKAFRQAIQADRRKPLPYMLLASCLYNEAQIAIRIDDVSVAQEKFAEARKTLFEAKRNRNQGNLPDQLKIEIDADYELLGKGDAKAAIPLYEQIVASAAESDSTIQSHVGLRAHWMLAGIYSGDWGQDALIDLERARHHLRAILAYWPLSDEAKFIKTKLRWDAQEGKSRFQHLPEHNKPLAIFFEPK